MDVLISVVAILLLLYCFLKSWRRKGMAIPGPPEWPLVGHGLSITQETVHAKFFEHAEKYGDIFKISVFGQEIIVLNNAKLVRKALGTDPYKIHLNDRQSTYFGKMILGNQSIITTEKAYSSLHGNLRKGFTKGLHVYGDGKKEFEDNVRTELQKLNDKLETLCGTDFDMVETIKRSLSSIVSILLGGHDMKDDDKELDMFWDFARAADFFSNAKVDALMINFPFLRFIPGLYKTRFDETVNAANTIKRRYIHSSKESYTPGVIRGIVDFFIEEQLQAIKENRDVVFTDERIVYITLEIIAAGIVTTLATLSTIFLCLLNHPEYQTKIQDEIDRVVGKDRLPTLGDKLQLPMTEAVTLEALRYAPSVPSPIPHKCNQNIDFEGFEIPKGSLIATNTWYIHHDKKIWGDPWNFRPERWLDENGEILPNDHYQRKNFLAFGYGRRQCIGESLARTRMFLYITTLLQRWNFEMSPEHQVSCDQRLGQFDFKLTCCPKPYYCKAVPRR